VLSKGRNLHRLTVAELLSLTRELAVESLTGINVNRIVRACDLLAELCKKQAVGLDDQRQLALVQCLVELVKRQVEPNVKGLLGALGHVAKSCANGSTSKLGIVKILHQLSRLLENLGITKTRQSRHNSAVESTLGGRRPNCLHRVLHDTELGVKSSENFLEIGLAKLHITNVIGGVEVRKNI